jgi:hypothetical protein
MGGFRVNHKDNAYALICDVYWIYSLSYEKKEGFDFVD